MSPSVRQTMRQAADSLARPRHIDPAVPIKVGVDLGTAFTVIMVTDENGNVICYDVSWSDKLYCDFTPAWDGYFYVTVQNMGGSRNSYYLMTN